MEPLMQNLGAPSLAEDLLLVLFQPDSGTITGESTLHYVLGGAVLAELACNESVTITTIGTGSAWVAAVEGQGPSDEILAPAWRLASEKPGGLLTMLTAIGPALRQPLLERLIARGDIREANGKELGLLKITTLSDGGSGRRSGLLASVRGLLVDGVESTPRIAALAALLRASGTLHLLDPQIPWSPDVITRAEELERRDWGAEGATPAVARATAAMIRIIAARVSHRNSGPGHGSQGVTTMTTESNLAEHPGFRRTFRKDHLTLGIFFPIEAFSGDFPGMQNQLELARVADEAGYAALWTRDVPVRDPHFGDVGQIHDTWVFTAYVAAVTRRIAVGTGSVILPLRAAVDLAKASSSLDVLSGGRFLFGVASGDRPVEFPLYGLDHARRGEIFRARLAEVRGLYQNAGPLELIRNSLGYPVEFLPRPVVAPTVPVLVTGFAQQSLDWVARNADGWMTYHRDPKAQKVIVDQWNGSVDKAEGIRHKPVMQSLYIDLSADPDAAATPIHLGYRLGRNRLKEILSTLRSVGIAHVAFNLKYGSRPAAEVVAEITEHVLPHFPSPG